MHFSTLEIIIFAVVASFVVFGPKPNFRRNAAQAQPEAVVLGDLDNVPPYVSRYAEDGTKYAAGRAPSPLKLRAAARPLRPALQFAIADLDGSPLPHELTGRW